MVSAGVCYLVALTPMMKPPMLVPSSTTATASMRRSKSWLSTKTLDARLLRYQHLSLTLTPKVKKVKKLAEHEDARRAPVEISAPQVTFGVKVRLKVT